MTETPTVCAVDDGGVITRISVSDTTVKLAAAVDPNRTPPAPVNPDPVKVTIVPPRRGPDDGSIVEIRGPEAVNAAAIGAPFGCVVTVPAGLPVAAAAGERVAPLRAHSPQFQVVVVVRRAVGGPVGGTPAVAGAVVAVGRRRTGGTPASGTVRAPSLAALDDAFDRLSAAVSLDDTDFIVSEVGRSRHCSVRRSGEVIPEYITDTLGRYSILFTAKDPNRYGDLVTQSTALPSSTGGRTYPATNAMGILSPRASHASRCIRPCLPGEM